MPKTNVRADARVKKAISFLQKCPAATVKEGMLIAGFSKKEIEDRAKQAWISRRHDKADSAADVPPPESIVITESAGGKGATTILSVSLLLEESSLLMYGGGRTRTSRGFLHCLRVK